MGCLSCCLSSCCSNKKKANPVVKNLSNKTSLELTQQMKTTLNGHIVNQKVLNNLNQLMTQKQSEQLMNDPEVSQDFKTVIGPPFNACNELLDFLYLTGIGGLTKENIIALGIRLIINATYEWPSLQTKTITTIRVPVDDSLRDNISLYFDDISDKIEECHCSGGKVLVHCMAGASRSTTIVLAYLIKYNGMPLKNAFIAVKKRRETARPNISFWEQLIRYEIRIRGLPSVRMLYVKEQGVEVVIPDLYQKEYPNYYEIEALKQIKMFNAKQNNPSLRHKSQKQFNELSLKYE